MALSTMKLIAFGQVPFTTYHYLMVPIRSKRNMPAARLIYKPRDAERNLTEILYPLYMWKLIWYQGKNPFLPPQDTGSIYEALSKQKWVESSTIAADHKICFVCFVEGGFKGKHFLADLVSLPNAAVVKFQKSRWVLKTGWRKLSFRSVWGELCEHVQRCPETESTSWRGLGGHLWTANKVHSGYESLQIQGDF